MKKSLFFLASAALVLASCNNDVKLDENTSLVTSNQPKEIAFSTIAKTPKRVAAKSGAIENATFPTDLDMKVVAWQQGAPGRDFFSATNFLYNYAAGNTGATHGYWGGNPARYWPLSPCYINFLAITNANDDNETGVTWGDAGATFASKVSVVMADNYAYNTKQHDFMYAIGDGEVTQTGNALTFPDKVDMTFKHAQAYLVFYVKAADTQSQAIKIKNIEIKGARFAGTATINHTNYNAQTGQATTLYWNPTTQTDLYKSVLADQTAKADEASSVALTNEFVQLGKIMVVPNMSAADTYQDNGTTYIKITYYLNSKEWTYEYEITGDTYEAGKKYIYDITFKLHEIYIKPAVTEWTEVTDYVPVVPVISISKDAATKEATLSNAAGTYLIEVTGLTAGETASVAETSDTNNIISGVALQGAKVGASGNVVIEVTKPATTNDKTATITLSVGTTPTDYVITIKTPVTPAP